MPNLGALSDLARFVDDGRLMTEVWLHGGLGQEDDRPLALQRLLASVEDL